MRTLINSVTLYSKMRIRNIFQYISFTRSTVMLLDDSDVWVVIVRGS